MTVSFEDFIEGKKKDPIVLLVDADIFIHKAANVADGRMYKVGSSVYKYKKDADEEAKKKNLKSELIFDPDPFDHAVIAYRSIMKSIRSAFSDYDVELKSFISSRLNFRKKILPSYKHSRDGIRKPYHLEALKEFVMDEFDGFSQDYLEADDLLGIYQTRYEAEGIDSCIVTVDKDLNNIPGPHYNPDKGIKFSVTKEEAMFNFYKQCLTGDKTDDIPGLKGIGPKRAEKIISSSNGIEEKDLYYTVVKAWEEQYKDLEMAIDLLEISAKCLWIRVQNDKNWEAPLRPDEIKDLSKQEEKTED